MAPSHVLVPLDGSPLSNAALTYALETFDCRITVLDVVTPLDSNMSEGGILDAGEERKAAADKRATGLIERAKSGLRPRVDTSKPPSSRAIRPASSSDTPRTTTSTPS